MPQRSTVPPTRSRPRWVPITVWVNNAMATVYSPIQEAEADEIKRVTEVTYLGAVNGTLAALRRMQGGHQRQVSSVLAWRAMPIQGAYCGAKFALRGFTEALRSELIHDRSPVHLTMVHLPAVNTPQFDWARNKTGRNGPRPPARISPRSPPTPSSTPPRTSAASCSSAPPRLRPSSPPASPPGIMDQVLARKAYSAQLGSDPAPVTDGNLFEPTPGADQQASGRFNTEANSRRDIFSSRQAAGVAAALVLGGGVALGMLALSPLVVGPALIARAGLRGAGFKV